MSTLGVNIPDHDMTFQSLSDMLKQSVSPHVTSVQAKECGGKGLRHQSEILLCSPHRLCFKWYVFRL